MIEYIGMRLDIGKLDDVASRQFEANYFAILPLVGGRPFWHSKGLSRKQLRIVRPSSRRVA
jgi:hypothetical protein